LNLSFGKRSGLAVRTKRHQRCSAPWQKQTGKQQHLTAQIKETNKATNEEEAANTKREPSKQQKHTTNNQTFNK
jgi:hypothetical protein